MQFFVDTADMANTRSFVASGLLAADCMMREAAV
jgi:hypothetical protein